MKLLCRLLGHLWTFQGNLPTDGQAMGILMMEDHIADNILGCVTS